MTQWQRFAKESFDRASALGLTVLAIPVFAFAVVVIKAFSRGPVIFAQERIGFQGEPFTIYKFRTMRIDVTSHEFGSVTVQNDVRFFPGAKLLRKFKIDELPQLLNVLNGTMSIIGPRPTVAEDHSRMTDRQRERSFVKPGLTGLAQIRGGAALPWPKRIEYDLEYIARYSLRLDAMILLHTFWLVLSGRADTNPIDADEWFDPQASEAGVETFSANRAA